MTNFTSSGLREEKPRTVKLDITKVSLTVLVLVVLTVEVVQVAMFGLQDSVPSLSQVRGPVTALKEEPLAANHSLSARSWMQPGIVDTSG